jgi:hypothetical protein
MQETIMMPAKAASKRRGMIWGLSLHGWEEVMRGSIAIVGVAGLIVGVATYFVVTLTREEASKAKAEFEEYKLDSAHKIAAAEAVGNTAQADIAKANAQIAEANARQKEAELKLGELRRHVAARHIDPEKFSNVLQGRPKAPTEIWFLKEDSEAYLLANEIKSGLAKSGWEVTGPVPIPSSEVAQFSDMPSTMGAGGQAAGVTIVKGSFDEDDMRSQIRLPGEPPLIDKPWRALQDALADPLGQLSTSMGGSASPEGEKLRIVVGPRPLL